MFKRGIVTYLLSFLSRNSTELATIILRFLWKLSVFKENKDLMVNEATTILDRIQTHLANSMPVFKPY